MKRLLLAGIMFQACSSVKPEVRAGSQPVYVIECEYKGKAMTCDEMRQMDDALMNGTERKTRLAPPDDLTPLQAGLLGIGIGAVISLLGAFVGVYAWAH